MCGPVRLAVVRIPPGPVVASRCPRLVEGREPPFSTSLLSPRRKVGDPSQSANGWSTPGDPPSSAATTARTTRPLMTMMRCEEMPRQLPRAGSPLRRSFASVAFFVLSAGRYRGLRRFLALRAPRLVSAPLLSRGFAPEEQRRGISGGEVGSFSRPSRNSFASARGPPFSHRSVVVIALPMLLSFASLVGPVASRSSGSSASRGSFFFFLFSFFPRRRRGSHFPRTNRVSLPPVFAFLESLSPDAPVTTANADPIRLSRSSAS